jgi:hypothetical protein
MHALPTSIIIYSGIEPSLVGFHTSGTGIGALVLAWLAACVMDCGAPGSPSQEKKETPGQAHRLMLL